MRRRFPISLSAAALAAAMVLPMARVAAGDTGSYGGVSPLVFQVTAYDEGSRPLRYGQGLVVGPHDEAVVSLLLLEGSARTVATLLDGRSLEVVDVLAVDGIAGLARVRLQKGGPSTVAKWVPGDPPRVAEQVLFSWWTVRGNQVCMGSGVRSIRPVPDLDGLYYLEVSDITPPPGSALFGADGRLAGMIVMDLGWGSSALMASKERIQSLAGSPIQPRTLAAWSSRRSRSWRDGPHAVYLEAYAALQDGQPQATLDLIQGRLDDWHVLTAQMKALEGEAYLAMDRLPQAIEALKASVDCSRAPCWVYQRLAWAYMEAGQRSLAEAACLKAIALDPDEPSPFLLLAHLRNLQGDYREAVYEARRVLKRKPDCACAHYERGVAYIGLGRYSEAIDALKSATTLDPAFGEAFAELGYAYLRSGQPLHAIVVLREAAEQIPEEAQTWDYLGEAYSRAGLADRALRAYGQSLCLDPSDPVSYYHLARQNQQLGRTSRALEVLRSGQDRLGEAPWLVYYLGKIYAMEGRLDLAAEQALNLQSTNRALGRQLQRVIDQASGL